MKRFYFLFIAIAASVSATAQDIIVMKNGDIVQSKVQEITPTEIKYKKFSNLNGPLYTIEKATVLSINYENGEKELMTSSDEAAIKDAAAEKGETSGLIEKVASPNNAELIQKYHPEIDFVLKPSNTDANYAYTVMAVTKSSILSNEDVEISIVPMLLRADDYWPRRELCHYIKIENKTDKVIYVDKANSFKIANDGISKPYYDSKQISVTRGNGSGVGINLGGVAGALGFGGTAGALASALNVGKSSGSSVTEVHSTQQILTISPHSSAYLSEYEYVMIKKMESKVISDGERWFADANLKRGVVKIGECVTYGEEESPYHNEYFITYSSSPDFSTYSTINFGVYSKYLVGTKNRVQFGRSEEKAVKNYQKYISNYWINKGILFSEACVLE